MYLWHMNIIDKKQKRGTKQGTSFEEVRFFYYIKKVFSETKNRHRVEINSKKIEVDIYIKSLNLAIEYDGMLYHSKDTMVEKDIKKNKLLNEKGILLLRIREICRNGNKTLPIISKNEFYHVPDSRKSLKKCTCELFDYISNNFELKTKQKNTISEIINSDFNDDTELYKFYSKTIKNNSISVTNPELSKDWNYNKNDDLLPEHVGRGSTVEVWWKCHKCENEWLASVHDRSHRNNKCMKCKSLGLRFPEVFNEWHPTKNNGKTPFDFTVGTEDTIWLMCKNGHTYDTTAHQRGKGKGGCSYCHSTKFHIDKSLAILNPKLAKEWHPNKNGKLTPSDVFLSNKKRINHWWLCPDGHEYEKPVRDRHYQNQGCPYCAGKKVSLENSLASCYPLVSNQWLPTKNGNLTPETVTRSSGRNVWWLCEECRNEWEAHINNRIRGCNKCQNCSEKNKIEEPITEYQTK